jgi:hypothetical protein
MRFAGFILLVLFFSNSSFGQSTILSGHVYNAENKDALHFASLIIQDSIVLTADADGSYQINLKPGYYSIGASYIGFKPILFYQVQIEPNKQNNLDIFLEPSSLEIDEINIVAESFQRTAESPLSIRKLGLTEVERLAGGVLDISKTIRSLPGVLPRVSFGYNIIIRGGASSENKYFLDGIEIPAINHFSVQGASGGPNGLINVDLIQSAELYSGAFPVNRSNALSGVLDMKLKTGRSDRIGGKASIGATDYGISLEGPLFKNASFFASYRNSYSQYLLKAIGLPIIPYYKDALFKVNYKWNEKNELSLIGLAGIDKSRLNLDAPASDALLYNIGYIPEGDQQLYTVGMHYKHYLASSQYHLVLSYNGFDNKAIKYKNNSFNDADILLDYNSTESALKGRFEHSIYRGSNTIEYGISFQRPDYFLDNYNITVNNAIQADTVDIKERITFLEYGTFVSWSSVYFQEKLSLFAGLRMDGNSFNSGMSSPISQFSPRASISYNITPKWNASIHAGRYFQLPPAILMLYGASNDALKYIKMDQVSIGQRFQINKALQFSTEAFYKGYSDYPFLLKDSISFANANANYVVVGDQSAESTSEGRAYGLEIYLRKNLQKRFYYNISYSWIVSEFKDKHGNYVPSSWDTRQFINLSGGFVFGKNWELGMKFIYGSSTPYTPYNVETSSLISQWDIVNRGVFDYNYLNSERLPDFYQFDIRLDKDFYFKKWNLNLYMDIQNFTRASIELLPYLTVERDENGKPLVDPLDSNRYKTQIINSDSGRVLPTIGIIAQF